MIEGLPRWHGCRFRRTAHAPANCCTVARTTIQPWFRSSATRQSNRRGSQIAPSAGSTTGPRRRALSCMASRRCWEAAPASLPSRSPWPLGRRQPPPLPGPRLDRSRSAYDCSHDVSGQCSRLDRQKALKATSHLCRLPFIGPGPSDDPEANGTYIYCA